MLHNETIKDLPGEDCYNCVWFDATDETCILNADCPTKKSDSAMDYLPSPLNADCPTKKSDLHNHSHSKNDGGTKMSWNVGSEGSASNGSTKVVSVQNGIERTHDFSGNTLLKDVVSQVAKDCGYGAVLVQANGSTVEPDAGNNPISQYGEVKIMPKFAGAC